MVQPHISQVDINYIIDSFDKYNVNDTRKLIQEREKHVMKLYRSMKTMHEESGLREYRRGQLNNFGKTLFYAHLLTSKSNLVTSSYNINGAWMVF